MSGSKLGKRSLNFRVGLAAIVISLAAACSSFAFTKDMDGKATVSDGSLADTQAALNFVRDRKEDGWVVTVGSAGADYTWAGQLVVDVQRDVTLQGQSASALTHIKSTANGGIGIFVNAGVNKVCTLRNFSFSGWSGPARLIQIEGTGVCFRLTNISVKAGYNDSAWLWIGSPGSAGEGEGPFGLIDHSTFEGYCAAFIRQNGSSRDAHWANDHAIRWGTVNAVFIEDCTYTGPTDSSTPATYTNDGGSAGKVVIRRCTLNDTAVAWHGRDSTGVANQLWRESFLAGEVYENHFFIKRLMVAPLVTIRGGTALVHDNKLDIYPTGSVGVGVQLQMHCAGGSYAGEGCLDCTDGSPMKRALVYPDNYPDCQQAGTPQPVRVWSNNHGFALTAGYGWCVGDSGFASKNRDFYLSDDDSAKLPGYTPFTYPHPLVRGAAPRPSPPSNLRVTPAPGT